MKVGFKKVGFKKVEGTVKMDTVHIQCYFCNLQINFL